MHRIDFRSLVLIVVVASCMPLSRALATASTHIWAPSTDVQPFNVWHVTSDLYLPIERDAAGMHLPAVTNLGLTVGVLPTKKLTVEVGFDHKSGYGPLDAYPMYVNLKIGVAENAYGRFFPAIAAGAYDVGTKHGRTDYNVLYAEVARTFSAGGVSLGRLSVGCFAGNEDLLVDASGEADASGLLAAWERTLTEISDRLWVCVEYMGTESAYGSLNVGASWKFAGNVSMIAGYDMYNNEDLVDTVTLQVDIDI
jgi:hypothetical protein